MRPRGVEDRCSRVYGLAVPSLRTSFWAAVAPALAGTALGVAHAEPPPPPVQAPAAVIAGLPSLELLTFNTWGLPFPIAQPRGERFPRIRRMLSQLAPDVAGLQEVWNGARRLLPLDGLLYPRSTHDTGLAVLSNHPVSSTRNLQYGSASGFDRFKGKGAMQATIEHPQLGPVKVVVTHLQAGRGAAARQARASQVDELLAFVADAPIPTVLMGDFNLYDELDSDARAHLRLGQAGFVDAAERLGVEEPTHGREQARLDRVYLRGLAPVEAEVLPAAGLSDHHPLRVRVSPGEP